MPAYHTEFLLMDSSAALIDIVDIDKMNRLSNMNIQTIEPLGLCIAMLNLAVTLFERSALNDIFGILNNNTYTYIHTYTHTYIHT